MIYRRVDKDLGFNGNVQMFQLRRRWDGSDDVKDLILMVANTWGCVCNDGVKQHRHRSEKEHKLS